jgi:hypothetical protein
MSSWSPQGREFLNDFRCHVLTLFVVVLCSAVPLVASAAARYRGQCTDAGAPIARPRLLCRMPNAISRSQRAN